MNEYVAKKLYKKMTKAGAKADVLHKVLAVLTDHSPECAKDTIQQMYQMYCNKEDHHRRLLGIKNPDEIDKNTYSMASGEIVDIADVDRKREIEFVPATPEEYETTVNELPISELQKMGFTRIEKGVGFAKQPEPIKPAKIFLAFPHEWRNIIPADVEYPDWTGAMGIITREDLDTMPVMMGCLPIGIYRESDGTEYIPTINVDKDEQDKGDQDK